MICPNCNAEVSTEDRFCPKCGVTLDPHAEAKTVVTDTPVTSSSNDKLMGILSYLGILALIPYFTKPTSSFVRFHALSGMNLFLLEIIASAGASIISLLVRPLGGVVSWLVSLASLAFSIIGIVNVCNGEKKDLPIIGSIRLIKE